jgi:hypothetical protein
MNNTPKTIQIFLPGGDPRGIRIAEITTRIVQVIEVPRSLLSDFLAMPECSQVAVYMLFGEGEEGGDQKVYIGQTGDLKARLTKHNKEKDFWERVLVLISRTDSLTQTHTLFLEWFSIKTAGTAGRFSLENGNSGARPHTPAPLEADCHEIFETARTLYATLGYPVFEPIAKPAAVANQEEIFYCKASGANGRGLYTEDGFVVLKDSIGRKENVASIIGTFGERLRDKLIASGVAHAEGEKLVFDKDHLFRSPSMAGLALMGRTSNGWVDWKDSKGRTLDEVKRPPLTSVEH